MNEAEVLAYAVEFLWFKAYWDGDCLVTVTTIANPKKRYPGVTIRGRSYRGNRVIYANSHGWDAIEGLSVLHSCDNSACINIEHLSAGTHQENMRQMMQRGRGRNQFASVCA